MTSPAWLDYARTQIGTREIPGPRHSPTVMGYVKRAAGWLGITVKDDETPWCGTFAAACMVHAGINPPKVAVRASSWASWGVPSEPRPGAVLVFTRQGGGHVGFYTGETATHYRVLGGNQGNAVSEVLIAKNRCTAVRWHPSVPPYGKRVWLAGATAPVSTNEA